MKYETHIWQIFTLDKRTDVRYNITKGGERKFEKNCISY